MNIYNFDYNEKARTLHVEFSLLNDNDTTYRQIELIYEDVAFYAPSIILENEMMQITTEEVIEILEEYFLQNELPEEQFF